jgi:acyl carrier protein
MSASEMTYQRLTTVFRRVFDDDAIELTPETTANDVEAWDSLSHVNLIVAVEHEFAIRLGQREILALRHVGDLVAAIERHVATLG